MKRQLNQKERHTISKALSALAASYRSSSLELTKSPPAALAESAIEASMKLASEAQDIDRLSFSVATANTVTLES